MTPHLFIDFDNTMMATEQYAVPSLIARFNVLYGQKIKSPLTTAIFKMHFHGQSRDILCQNLSAYFGINVEVDALYADREWLVMQHLQSVAGGIGMAPYLVETLTDLQRDHGVTACLVSNNPVQRALTAMRFASNGQGDALAALLGTRMFEAGDIQKPQPDVYLRALAQTGAQREKSCAIEDSASGVTAAVKAGLITFGYIGLSDDFAPDADKLRTAGAVGIFDDWMLLPALLKRHGLI